jgi:hypothetical protein
VGPWHPSQSSFLLTSAFCWTPWIRYQSSVFDSWNSRISSEDKFWIYLQNLTDRLTNRITVQFRIVSGNSSCHSPTVSSSDHSKAEGVPRQEGALRGGGWRVACIN